MDLFIQLRNGQPFEHPIVGDNFRDAFPHIDVNNLPPEFAKFIRVPQPKIDFYEAIEDKPVYEWVGDVVQDVWKIRPLTENEREEKIHFISIEANNYVEFLKTRTLSLIDTVSNEADKQAYITYLAELNAWVLVDPANLKIPKFTAPIYL